MKLACGRECFRNAAAIECKHLANAGRETTPRAGTRGYELTLKGLQTPNFRSLAGTNRHDPEITLDQVVKVRVLALQPLLKSPASTGFLSEKR
jgi:hypothetical protein